MKSLRHPLFLSLAAVCALSLIVVLFWNAHDEENTATVSVTINARGPIILPAARAGDGMVSNEEAVQQLGRPMSDIIAQLGKPDFADGVSWCWWSKVNVPNGAHHLRIDGEGPADAPVATSVIVLTESGHETLRQNQ